MHKHWLIVLFIVLLLPSCRNASTDESNAGSDRPNILLILSDDQRFDTIAALGNPDIKTPNLDKLVRGGTAFTRAHIMGGFHGAICAPSRAMLMTGRKLFDLFETGDIIPEIHTMLPQILAQSGYSTFGTGKWHNNRDAYARSFQHGENIFFGGMHFPENGGHEAPWLNAYDSTGVFANEDAVQTPGFSSTLYTDALIRFLDSQRDVETPFFGYLAFTSPHDPRTPPAPYDLWYSPDSISVPPNLLPEHPFDNGQLDVRDELLLGHPRMESEVLRELALYYGMISEMDAQIGRILETLETNGQLENTLIIFAGDNGLAVGSHGLLGKQNLYDHSVRVPLIFHGPGIPIGEKRDQFAYLFDVFPTIADYLDLDLPESARGNSLLQTINEQETESRPDVFYAFRDLQRGIRTENNWKLIRYDVNGVQTTQLFDLNTDPYETHDLSNDPEFAERRASLDSLLLARSRELGDRWELSAPNWGKPRPTETAHLALRKGVSVREPFSNKYPGAGPDGLVDGILCVDDTKEPCWQAYESDDLDVTINLGAPTSIKSVEPRFLRNQGSWIFLPRNVRVSVSEDGHNYHEVARVDLEPPKLEDPKQIQSIPLSFPEELIQYVHIVAENEGVCPPWHGGAGGKAWLFVDEIIVL